MCRRAAAWSPTAIPTPSTRRPAPRPAPSCARRRKRAASPRAEADRRLARGRGPRRLELPQRIFDLGVAQRRAFRRQPAIEPSGQPLLGEVDEILGLDALEHRIVLGALRGAGAVRTASLGDHRYAPAACPGGEAVV